MSAAPKQCHYFTLSIKRSYHIKTHSVITDNCKKPDRNISLQLFDSTTCRQPRLQRRQLSEKHNVRIKSSVRNEMTTARHGTSGKTTTPLTHSCSNHGVIQVGPLGSDTMFEVVKISDVYFFRYLKCQDDLYQKNKNVQLCQSYA